MTEQNAIDLETHLNDAERLIRIAVKVILDINGGKQTPDDLDAVEALIFKGHCEITSAMKAAGFAPA